MLGTKFYKNKLETQEQLGAYTAAAEWCNETQNGMIADKGEYYEIVPIPQPSQEELNEIEIERLKAELASTDYKCWKFVDGALTEEEYAEVRAYRANLRQQINALGG